MEYLRYFENRDGTGRAYEGCGFSVQLFFDLELHPVYQKARWVDFSAAKDGAGREYLFAVEKKLEGVERNIDGWLGSWRLNMFAEEAYRMWHPDDDDFIVKSDVLGSGTGGMGEYVIYGTTIPGMISETIKFLGDDADFEDLKTKLAECSEILNELNYDMQSFEYSIPDYYNTPDDERHALHVEADDAVLGRFLARILNMAEKLYATSDADVLWETSLLRGFKNDIWEKAPELAEKYNIPART